MAVQDKVTARKEQRQARLTALTEKREFLQRKVDESEQVNALWQKVWDGITDTSVHKPPGTTWKEFFDGIAATKLDSTPIMFDCSEVQLPKSQMMMTLAVHISTMQAELEKESKMLQNIVKSVEACQRVTENAEKHAKKQLAVLVDPVQTEKTHDLAKSFGCTHSQSQAGGPWGVLTCPRLHLVAKIHTHTVPNPIQSFSSTVTTVL